MLETRLPTQILLNNILYDISEVRGGSSRGPQPTSTRLHPQLHARYRTDQLDVRLLDILRDAGCLKADEALFQTGWFVESLSTQVLVIFIIRTRGNPLRSRAHPLLAVTSLAVVTIAVLLPFTPLGTYFGFVLPPAMFYAILAAMVMTYLAMVEVAKEGRLPLDRSN